jgi:phosphotransferase system HPr (HPr) family protein
LSGTANRQVRIRNDLGLHLRAAGALVQLACKFTAEVKLQRGEVEANAKSIMSVLSLAAAKGVQLCIVAEGDDAVEAVDALTALIEAGFHQP